MLGRAIRILLAITILVVPTDVRAPASPHDSGHDLRIAIAAAPPAGARPTISRQTHDSKSPELACPRISSDGDEPEGEEWIAPVLAPFVLRLQFDSTLPRWTAPTESSPPSRSIVRLLC